MKSARVSDGLLSAPHTMELIGLLAKSEHPISSESMAKQMLVTYQAPFLRTKNTIDLLVEMCLLDFVDGLIRVSNKFAEKQQNVWNILSGNVAQKLVERIEEHRSWACMQFDLKDHKIIVNSMLLPPMTDGLGIWILGFRLASRFTIEEQNWTISPKYYDFFLDQLRTLNFKDTKKAKSSSQLKNELDYKLAAGIAAEDWVVNFERIRLRSHTNRDQVRRISDEDIAAGYDILSFSSLQSLRHDRFIEVKSFSGKKHFFWSRNEIEIARQLGDDYHLYLVDRELMNTKGYSPTIISGPTPEIFQLENSDWSVAVESLVFSEIKVL